jgi:hypothetical protein
LPLLLRLLCCACSCPGPPSLPPSPSTAICRTSPVAVAVWMALSGTMSM